MIKNAATCRRVLQAPLGRSRRAIASSSVLRYSLASVMAAVVDNLDDLAIRRLEPHLDVDGLDRSDADEVPATADLMPSI